MHDRITVRMTTEMIERIDSWIAAQPGYVSRQEAVRLFVDMALKHTDQVSRHRDGRTGASSPLVGLSALTTRPNPER